MNPFSDLAGLLREPITRWLLGFVAIAVLMRLVLPFVSASSAAGRFILYFWHPEARRAGGQVDEPLRRLTLRNMDSMLIQLAVVFLLIWPFVLRAYYIPSSSMEPTLYGVPGVRQDRVLVNRYLYHLREPQRGEILVFRAPPAATDPGPRQDFIKRLVGLPGETVEIRGHHAYINGQKLNEPYLSDDFDPTNALADRPPVVVPPGHYFMMGDNRDNSADSRVWGTLPAAEVQGRAMCVFWPAWARDPRARGERAGLTLRYLDSP